MPSFRVCQVKWRFRLFIAWTHNKQHGRVGIHTALYAIVAELLGLVRNKNQLFTSSLSTTRGGVQPHATVYGTVPRLQTATSTTLASTTNVGA
mgnify:CR=1 FL=1